jgi:hypothetical protein
VAREATGEELLELALDESWIAESVLRMIARGIEQRRDMILHDAIEHGVFRLTAGIATCCGRGSMGVVAGKHGRRAGEAGAMPRVRAKRSRWVGSTICLAVSASWTFLHSNVRIPDKI